MWILSIKRHAIHAIFSVYWDSDGKQSLLCAQRDTTDSLIIMLNVFSQNVSISNNIRFVWFIVYAVQLCKFTSPLIKAVHIFFTRNFKTSASIGMEVPRNCWQAKTSSIVSKECRLHWTTRDEYRWVIVLRLCAVPFQIKTAHQDPMIRFAQKKKGVRHSIATTICEWLLHRFDRMHHRHVAKAVRFSAVHCTLVHSSASQSCVFFIALAMVVLRNMKYWTVIKQEKD